MLPVVFALAVAPASGCHKTESVSTAARPPVADIQKTDLERKTWQINQSSLPPDQKQRLISRLRAAGGGK